MMACLDASSSVGWEANECGVGVAGIKVKDHNYSHTNERSSAGSMDCGWPGRKEAICRHSRARSDDMRGWLGWDYGNAG